MSLLPFLVAAGIGSCSLPNVAPHKLGLGTVPLAAVEPLNRPLRGGTTMVVRRIAIEKAAEFTAATNPPPKGLSFDRHDLWVLTAGSLIKIGVPPAM